MLPDLITEKLTDLTPQLLSDRGITLLMMDFDNTIVPYTTDIPVPEVENWLRDMLTSQVRICVVSNSRNSRVRVFCEKRGIPCITHAKKPFSKGIRQCLQRFDTAPQQAALVGDQIFTDTLGANCAGITSILVEAIDNHTIWLKLRHVAELPFIAIKRRMTYEKH